MLKITGTVFVSSSTTPGSCVVTEVGKSKTSVSGSRSESKSESGRTVHDSHLAGFGHGVFDSQERFEKIDRRIDLGEKGIDT